MRLRHIVTGASAALAVSAAALAFWEAPKPPAPPVPGTLAAWAKPDTLGGEERFITAVSTDKPIYRGGETVYVRGVLLRADNHKPASFGEKAPGSADGQFMPVLQITGPKGDVVVNQLAHVESSVCGFGWTIPEGQSGGEYTAKITYPHSGYAPAERKFDVRAYRAPQLKSQIKFVRDGYGPGDAVQATLHVERAEGSLPAGAKVHAQALVDGAVVYEGETTVDALGDCRVEFKLPAELARGEGSLGLTVQDGGVVETASKTIPILLQTVDLKIYPEGGDLVAGVAQRVYIEARTPAQKPADLVGEVVDSAGRVVAPFRTEHEGRGRFRFTPQAKEKYTLRITEPAGIKTTFPLPEPKPAGAVIAGVGDEVPAGKKIALLVGAAAPGQFTVTIAKREKELGRATIQAAPGEPRAVEVPVDSSADGVLVATVWSADGKPLAERLLFRRPQQELKLEIKANRPSYTPGGRVELTIKATDAQGKPVKAMLGVTATSDGVLEMIEKREQAPRLPVMVLLEQEVNELADAHVYLDSANPQAPVALDLLLGTQGWRRFALVETDKFLQQHGDAASRALAFRLPTFNRNRWDDAARFGGFGGGNFFGAAPGAPAAPAPEASAPLEKGFAVEEAAGSPASGPEPALGEPADKAPQIVDAPVNAPDEKPGREKADDDRKMVDREQAQSGAPPSEPRAGAARALQAGKKEAAAKRQVLAGDFDLRDEMAESAPLVIVREFAHRVRDGRRPGDRVDFTETVFWNAGVFTSEKTGEATIGFELSDAVAGVRVFADAFNAEGALASSSILLESVEPFYFEPKTPLEVTAGDFVRMPIAVVNGTETAFTDVALNADAGAIGAALLKIADLPAGSRQRAILELPIGTYNGTASLVVSGSAGAYADKITRPLVVKPRGFPTELGRGGMLSSANPAVYEFVVPETLVPGSLTTKAAVYPTPLGSLADALERMIQEPYGCFEQTSSSTYPLVMAQQYFMSHTGVDPSLIARSAGPLEAGYQRLAGYECKSGGFEWFGEDPGHPALTAFGLMEFTDMSKVRSVDPALLARTRKWLLGKRDGKGGFDHSRRALHTWLAEPEVANAYVAWALLESGEKELAAEVKWVGEAAAKTANSFVLALAANVLHLGGDEAGYHRIVDKLIGRQDAKGFVSGATQSIVGSSDETLDIETTALAALAWLRNPAYTDNARRAVEYLAEQCKGGRYGSTQSTVLTLRAIVAWDQATSKPKAPGSLQLVLDGQPIGEAVAFDKDSQGALALPDFSAGLKPGKHTVQVRMQDGAEMPYMVAVNFSDDQPASSEKCRVDLQATLARNQFVEGDLGEVRVRVVNRANEKLPNPMAIIGLPGGLEPRHDQLKELVKAGKIAAYEVRGRDVIFYWRAFEPEAATEVAISVIAALPGDYTGPASRAYLYYADQDKDWVPGLTCKIAPRP
ncbi:MAG TPA: MG2 domain-containing protein [Pirellulales bacterium]